MQKKAKIRMKKELINRRVSKIEELSQEEQDKLTSIVYRNPAYESDEEEEYEEEEESEIEMMPQEMMNNDYCKKPAKEIAGPNLNLFDITKCQDIYYQIKVDK